jgi:hypothetical protein
MSAFLLLKIIPENIIILKSTFKKLGRNQLICTFDLLFKINLNKDL